MGLRPGVSQPQDLLFILWALIEEQQRLIFMEKKIIKAGKGREEEGEGLVLVTDSKRLWQVGVWQCPPLRCGGGAQCQGGWGPPGLCTEGR